MTRPVTFTIPTACVCVALTAGAITPAIAGAADVPRTAAAFATETLRLDSHRAGPAISTRQKLRAGHRFALTVRGTASYYSPWSYSRAGRALCGTTEPRPMFPSPGTLNGPVGVDAEFVFGRPRSPRGCSGAPGRWTNFKIRTSRFYFHQTPDGGSPTAPSAGHTYTYTILGRGLRARFKLVDAQGPGARDNYGMLRMKVREVTA